ncbi:MAG: hypothetical protein EPN97_17205 [Alphaproteobacteria bacterium]|nr:MAG: hypothetical protein EPN97_17205 [Alphaproteobacteria bacterium]
MAKKEFNDAADKKISGYIINLSQKELDPINEQVRPFQFKRDLGDWVAAQTGCVPAIDILNETVATASPQMMIQCTQEMADKIQAHFADDIAGVRKTVQLSDIPPEDRGCWKPRGKHDPKP